MSVPGGPLGRRERSAQTGSAGAGATRGGRRWRRRAALGRSDDDHPGVAVPRRDRPGDQYVLAGGQVRAADLLAALAHRGSRLVLPRPGGAVGRLHHQVAAVRDHGAAFVGQRAGGAVLPAEGGLALQAAQAPQAGAAPNGAAPATAPPAPKSTTMTSPAATYKALRRRAKCCVSAFIP